MRVDKGGFVGFVKCERCLSSYGCQVCFRCWECGETFCFCLNCHTPGCKNYKQHVDPMPKEIRDHLAEQVRVN